MSAFIVLFILAAMSLGFLAGFVVASVMVRRSVHRALSTEERAAVRRMVDEKVRQLAPNLYADEAALKALEKTE